MMASGLIRDDGYDYNAIQIVMDVHSVPSGRRPTIFKQITNIIRVISDEKRRRKQNAG